MSKGFEVVKEKVVSTIIGGDGNWHCNADKYKCFLKNENNEKIVTI